MFLHPALSMACHCLSSGENLLQSCTAHVIFLSLNRTHSIDFTRIILIHATALLNCVAQAVNITQGKCLLMHWGVTVICLGLPELWKLTFICSCDNYFIKIVYCLL